MTIRVALHHKTHYRYDRLVNLGPHVIRLRPAPHCRTPVSSYSLKVWPEKQFCNWQQDPQGNYQARLVFPEKAKELRVEVDLIADMTVINPFDFFLEPHAENSPFTYEAWLARELRPFREFEPPGPKLKALLASIDLTPIRTNDFLVAINRRVNQMVRYVIRLEPGVQTPEETLRLGSGSCRDSAWLLVQLFRNLGLAARFASGYLIQLQPDVKPLEGPAALDFTDLHAWCEVYLPGAGWVGLDPTSGLLTGEGHLPLACTPDPNSAAPITGMVDPCEVEFDFAMSITRIHEDPRVTKPYTEDQWRRIDALGAEVDRTLQVDDVRLTMGGEPTFVSIDDMDGPEWNVAAVGPAKRELSEKLIKRLRERFAPGGLLHYGQGKWYPGESLPRWALACFWRADGQSIWHNPDWVADVSRNYGYGPAEARIYARQLARVLEIDPRWIVAAYEDIFHYLWKERRLPVDVDPRRANLRDPEERARLARVFERGLEVPVGYVMPLRRQWWQAKAFWTSGPWPVRPERMFLLPGDSPIGLRLPLESLPAPADSYATMPLELDPLAPKPPLPDFQRDRIPSIPAQDLDWLRRQRTNPQPFMEHDQEESEEHPPSDAPVVRTALCIEARQGRLHVFMPPIERLEDYLDLSTAIETTCEQLQMPVVIEGYLPPPDYRVNQIKVTPDPGVIEVNIHPANDWRELVENTTVLYEDARQTRLGTEKFDLDGKHSGTGGGNHVVLGGRTPNDSPFLRRPDLLKSMVAYWNNHPSLSYLFSGRFIGPTSQSPRLDEGRRDALYEMAIAFAQTPSRTTQSPPWLVDRIFRHLLTDLTGNTHRAEFCIDKLFSPDSASGRLGLVELRALEMPPHPQMSLTQQLLIRALVAWFWRTPYEQPLTAWGTAIHDRFLMPYFVQHDFADVLAELRRAGFAFEPAWFAPHFEFRFPAVGEVAFEGIHLELRQAIEPWYVLGEEPGGGGTVRFVDSSVERMQALVRGMPTAERFAIACNGRRLPLHPTGRVGEFVAAVRYRAWHPASCLHPTIPVHTPLIFDFVDLWQARSIGGCTYHVAHPGGRSYDTFPVNAYEAEARRTARFFKLGHTGGALEVVAERPDRDYPYTLDLRRGIEPA